MWLQGNGLSISTWPWGGWGGMHGHVVWLEVAGYAAGNKWRHVVEVWY